MIQASLTGGFNVSTSTHPSRQAYKSDAFVVLQFSSTETFGYFALHVTDDGGIDAFAQLDALEAAITEARTHLRIERDRCNAAELSRASDEALDDFLVDVGQLPAPEVGDIAKCRLCPHEVILAVYPDDEEADPEWVDCDETIDEVWGYRRYCTGRYDSNNDGHDPDLAHKRRGGE